MSSASTPSADSKFDPLRLLIDGGLAAALAGVLLMVLVIDLLLPPKPIEEVHPIVTPPPVPVATVVKRLKIAVTEPEFDDIGKILDNLGEAYKYTDINLDDLTEDNLRDRFDVIFISCGTVKEDWVARVTNETGGRNSTRVILKEDKVRRLKTNLRKFVEDGGTIYSSDWRYQLLSIPFPEFESSDIKQGDVQNLDADVVDSGLQDVIGKTIELRFDLPAWYPATFEARPRQITEVLRGTYRDMDGNRVTAPLLVKFAVGKGNVIFTSFHNEKTVSEKQEKLLKYLVFSSVTAGTSAEVNETMVKGGFAPQKQSILSASQENPSAVSIYENTKAGELKVVLAAEGASFELELTSPSGTKIKKAGSDKIVIDVPNAAKGKWNCKVTATKVPHANFPYSLTFGHK